MMTQRRCISGASIGSRRQDISQYEISNVALPGRMSRHNLKYWQDGEWLGFGCGAHSTVDGVRWKNVSATADYIDRVTAGESVRSERRDMPVSERLEEAMFTGLETRRRGGCGGGFGPIWDRCLGTVLGPTAAVPRGTAPCVGGPGSASEPGRHAYRKRDSSGLRLMSRPDWLSVSLSFDQGGSGCVPS